MRVSNGTSEKSRAANPQEESPMGELRMLPHTPDIGLLPIAHLLHIPGTGSLLHDITLSES